MSEKLKPQHLARKAVLYIQQSTAMQVAQNQESQRLQYGMEERLRALGWAEIEAEPAAAKDKPLSALGAAARVLSKNGQPMSCPELIQAMAAKGYWTSPAGKTPAAAIALEIKVKKDQSRFRKADRGKFGLA
jgi:hypothetical protein